MEVEFEVKTEAEEYHFSACVMDWNKTLIICKKRLIF
jgi:hypothetical protein